jgi:hypothetical protein
MQMPVYRNKYSLGVFNHNDRLLPIPNSVTAVDAVSSGNAIRLTDKNEIAH